MPFIVTQASRGFQVLDRVSCSTSTVSDYTLTGAHFGGIFRF